MMTAGTWISLCLHLVIVFAQDFSMYNELETAAKTQPKIAVDESEGHLLLFKSGTVLFQSTTAHMIFQVNLSTPFRHLMSINSSVSKFADKFPQKVLQSKLSSLNNQGGTC